MPPSPLRHLVMVCTGNTCRSPLAAALLQAQLHSHPTLHATVVRSAGLRALPGAPASEGSYLVGLELGVDLAGHAARRLDRGVIDRADLVLTMTTEHRLGVLQLASTAPVQTLAAYAGFPADLPVPDPFGGTLDDYRALGRQLTAWLPAVVMRLEQEALS